MAKLVQLISHRGCSVPNQNVPGLSAQLPPKTKLSVEVMMVQEWVKKILL